MLYVNERGRETGGKEYLNVFESNMRSKKDTVRQF